jgi:hypothetical protein
VQFDKSALALGEQPVAIEGEIGFSKVKKEINNTPQRARKSFM